MGEPLEADVVAVGGDLTPATLRAAYRQGMFPMHVDGALAWWAPQQRGVLEPSQFHASRSLRRSARKFSVSIDAAFGEVVDGCGDPRRPHGWINDEIREAYGEMHDRGHAHSFEVWDRNGELVGGLYGVGINGLFAAESKFSLATDASKVAVWHLASTLVRGGGDRLIDVQWLTPHLASFGCTEVTAGQYQLRLKSVLATPDLDWSELAQSGRTTPIFEH